MNRACIVQHQNTVFRQLANRLPFCGLRRLIAEHHADKRVRRLGTEQIECYLNRTDRVLPTLPARLAESRVNPMGKAVREITVRLDTGHVLRIVSNDLDAPAEKIAALYKRRWAIELFFRWIKQTLKPRNFYGPSENAVRIQIAGALIAFVLIRLTHQAYNGRETLTHFGHLVRATILHRKPLQRFRLQPDTKTSVSPNHAQGSLQWV